MYSFFIPVFYKFVGGICSSHLSYGAVEIRHYTDNSNALADDVFNRVYSYSGCYGNNSLTSQVSFYFLQHGAYIIWLCAEKYDIRVFCHFLIVKSGFYPKFSYSGKL